ncbi:MAG: peptidase [Paenibacillus sp.]|jgi:stage II sporulation protein Q|uniref:peptidoglycan DD-metalloendopeptidase family protein n=1 Tax=Paenibacillus sp. GCM10012303 TaxID=3317340 RepID=UPI0029F40AD0|nr:peptidase [Paenibacillus sp.]
MSDQNKEQELKTEESAPKSTDGAVKPSSWKRLLAKKWVFPATYMAAAAIILTLMWVYTDSGVKNLSEQDLGLGVSKTQDVSGPTDKPDALPVAATAETMQWPVKDKNEVEVLLHFFDTKASHEVRQAAMIEYGDTLTPHVGVDLGREDDQPFDVLAAMSGKVTRVEKDPIVGQLVEITHQDGTVSIYQSLSDVKVAKDVQVKKGDIIAVAGRNELEKEMGTHVHFEVRQNGSPVNPESLIIE